MKKLLALLTAFIMALALSGCVEYIEPDDGKTSVSSETPDGKTDENGEDEDAFTVTLTYLGLAFVPETSIKAQWTDEEDSSVHTAAFDDTGVAKISGLDGDYRVTLSALPEGYTYNPNIYEATNDEKDVTVSLYKLNKTTGTGTGLYAPNIININVTGAYRATLTGPGQTVFFEYAPIKSGTYSVQSLIDVTANEINPILDVYQGSFAWKPQYPTFTTDGGASESTYTKNFYWEIQLTTDELKNTYAFGIRADSITGAKFPVDIDFIIERDGEFTRADDNLPPAQYVEEFKATPEYSKTSYTFTYSANANGMILMSSLYALDPSDGYYHRYDPLTDTYGEILYAKISKDCTVLSTQSGGGFTDGQVSKKIVSVEDGIRYDFSAFVEKYAEYTNSDGVYAVTEELKNFLQSFAAAQCLFNDGDGIAEAWYGYNSAEDDMWLFACGYYVAK